MTHSRHPPHGTESLARRVSHAIADLGQATLDDIRPLFPQHTRTQVHAAIGNARDSGLVRVKVQGMGIGYRKGRLPAVWELVPEEERGTSRKPEIRPVRPAASVFELGDDRPRLRWPPAFDGGRAVCVLGPWNEGSAT